MLRRISYIFFFTFTIISLSCAESGNGYELSAGISEKAFYSRPDQIIQHFEKNSGNCQKNFILAKAYKDKKELKSALIYYANSCFDKKYNFNIRLFPQPVYSFVESSSGRSIFYNDSLYEIARLSTAAATITVSKDGTQFCSFDEVLESAGKVIVKSL